MGTPERGMIVGEGIAGLMILPAASGCKGAEPDNDDRARTASRRVDHMTETPLHRLETGPRMERPCAVSRWEGQNTEAVAQSHSVSNPDRESIRCMGCVPCTCKTCQKDGAIASLVGHSCPSASQAPCSWGGITRLTRARSLLPVGAKQRPSPPVEHTPLIETWPIL